MNRWVLFCCMGMMAGAANAKGESSATVFVTPITTSTTLTIGSLGMYGFPPISATRIYESESLNIYRVKYSTRVSWRDRVAYVRGVNLTLENAIDAVRCRHPLCTVWSAEYCMNREWPDKISCGVIPYAMLPREGNGEVQP